MRFLVGVVIQDVIRGIKENKRVERLQKILKEELQKSLKEEITQTLE